MIKHEGISWILDRPHTEIEELKKKYPDSKEYLNHYFEYESKVCEKRIDFVHSLGMKCDSVGWSYLDLNQPDALKILDEIKEFCQKDGWFARGGYGCRYTDFESDWYEVSVPEVKDISQSEGNPYAIYAYKNCNKPIFFGWHNFIPVLVSEKFREVCLENSITGINFCWAKDLGRYDSLQYAFMYPESRIKTIACDKGLIYSDRYFPYNDGAGGTEYKHTEKYIRHDNMSPLCNRLRQLGDKLPFLADVFYDFQFNLPDYYCKSELPESGFAFIQGTSDGSERQTLLVHKNTAEILIKEKMLDRKALCPTLIYDNEIPAGYIEAVFEGKGFGEFDANYAIEMEKEYHRIKKLNRPQRKITESQALKALREAKRNRKEDFEKRIKKELSENLLETAYAPLVPYLLIADGAFLSDEYELLSYEASAKYTSEFRDECKKEELSDTLQGIVFGKCADGDVVVWAEDKSVVRISHETFDIEEKWSSLAEFFFDAVTG